MSRFDPERKTSSRDFRFNEAKQLDRRCPDCGRPNPEYNIISPSECDGTCTMPEPDRGSTCSPGCGWCGGCT